VEDFSWLQDMIADDDLGLLNVKKDVCPNG
jgi:hypothetical protein